MQLGEIYFSPWILGGFAAYICIYLGFIHARIKRKMVCKRRGRHRWALTNGYAQPWCLDCGHEAGER